MVDQQAELTANIALVVGIMDDKLPTDEQAKREMEFAKKIIDHHADMGWLVDFGQDRRGNLFYTYWDGRYQAMVERDAEAAA